jgi:hypothetical protein
MPFYYVYQPLIEILFPILLNTKPQRIVTGDGCRRNSLLTSSNRPLKNIQPINYFQIKLRDKIVKSECASFYKGFELHISNN